MPDRLRTALGHPLPERASMLMRERQSSSPDSSSGSGSPSGSGSSQGSGSSSGSSGPSSGSSGSSSGSSDDNPFAAPPEDRPDQPWQPRHPSHAPGNQDNGGNGDGTEGHSDDRPVWGSQWSDRQPGRQSGGFGGRPGGTGGPSGQGGGPEGNPGGLRWDPTDPAQRRARYAVLGGMWAFFFALFDFPEIAMLLGALAVYWSISALRGGPRKTQAAGTGPAAAAVTDRATTPPLPGSAPGATPGTTRSSSRQQTTAAVSGLVTALLALAIVATGYTVQLVYRDYYTCVNDALTKSGAIACNEKLPDPLEPFFGVKK
ncbi:hypothetical protein ACFWFI_41830 [Streptomyces sp. NPDC060209]|uniref:hypothetical protein n=1 Tax=Streptomyces sp. NPDC060209 TaxID=3347073 RepID=UPI00366485C3